MLTMQLPDNSIPRIRNVDTMIKTYTSTLSVPDTPSNSRLTQ